MEVSAANVGATAAARERRKFVMVLRELKMTKTSEAKLTQSGLFYRQNEPVVAFPRRVQVGGPPNKTRTISTPAAPQARSYPLAFVNVLFWYLRTTTLASFSEKQHIFFFV